MLKWIPVEIRAYFRIARKLTSSRRGTIKIVPVEADSGLFDFEIFIVVNGNIEIIGRTRTERAAETIAPTLSIRQDGKCIVPIHASWNNPEEKDEVKAKPSSS